MASHTENQTLEDLKKTFLDCPQCHQLFDDQDRKPQLLPCLHTICSCCLNGQANEEGVECCVCKKRHQAKDDFPVDNNRRELLQFYAVQRNASDVLRCENGCEGDDITVWCSDCSFFLCNDCEKYHRKMRSTRSHLLENIADLTHADLGKFKQKLFCKIKGHEKFEMSRFCSQCQKVICIQCSETHHKDIEGHSVILCSEEYNKKRDDLKGTLDKLDELNVNIRKLEASIEATLQSLKTTEEEQVNQIDMFVNNFNKELEKRGNCLKAEAHKHCAAKKEVIEGQLRQIHSFKKIMNDSSRFTTKTLEHDNPASFLLIQPTIVQNLDDILKEETGSCPNENDIVLAKLPDMRECEAFLRSNTEIRTTSIFPPNTKVHIPPDLSSGGITEVLHIRMYDYCDQRQPPDTEWLDIQLSNSNGEPIIVKEKRINDGEIIVVANLENENSFTASVSVLGTKVFEKSIDVDCMSDEEKGSVRRVAQPGLEQMDVAEIKSRYLTCCHCKVETDADAHLSLLLPCLHVICQSCFDKHFQTDGAQLRCPKCNVLVPNQHGKDANHNPFFSVMKTYVAVRCSEDKPVPCGVEDCNKQSTCLCISCGRFMCDICSSNYKKHLDCPSNDPKRLTDIRQDPSMVILRKTRCRKGHQNGGLERYCESCQKYFDCVMCFLSSDCNKSQDHICRDDIDAVYQERRQAMNVQLQELQKRQGELQQRADSVRTSQDVLKGHQDKVLMALNDAFKKRENTLQTKRKSLSKDVRKRINHIVTGLQSKIDIILQEEHILQEKHTTVGDLLVFSSKTSLLDTERLAFDCIKGHLEFNLGDKLRYPWSTVWFQEGSFKDLGAVLDTTTFPWRKTKVTLHDKVYVRQRNQLASVMLYDFEGNLVDDYKEGLVEVKVNGPKNEHITITPRQDSFGIVDVSISPEKEGKYSVHVTVMKQDVEGGSGTFEVVGKPRYKDKE